MFYLLYTVTEFWKRLYFTTFLRVVSQCKNSEIISCFSCRIPFQGAFHFPMENKVKECCCRHFPAPGVQRPLLFTSQECRAAPLVGLNFGKIHVILHRHSLRGTIQTVAIETEEDIRLTFLEADVRTVLV